VAAGSEYVQFDIGRSRVFELIKRSDLPQYDRRRFQVGFAAEDIERAHEQLLQQGAEPISEIMKATPPPGHVSAIPKGMSLRSLSALNRGRMLRPR
jgi:hypothetical protein